MAPVTLGSMTPAQEESWLILLDLYTDFPDGWCRRGLRVLKVLIDENHKAWRSIGERSILGNTTLRFLLDA